MRSGTEHCEIQRLILGMLIRCSYVSDKKQVVCVEAGGEGQFVSVRSFLPEFFFRFEGGPDAV